MSCMNLIVLCFECHMRPFEALILLVMNRGKGKGVVLTPWTSVLTAQLESVN